MVRLLTLCESTFGPIVLTFLFLFHPIAADAQTANQAEVGREVSRNQGTIPFQTSTGTNPSLVETQQLPQRQEYGELGILYNAKPIPTFTLQTFAGAFYTTNAALLPHNEISDWYFQQGLNFGWSKPFYQSSLIPHFSIYQAWFEYARTGTAGVENFSAMDVDVGLTYVIKKLSNIALSVDYIYERLADLPLQDEIFHENHLVFGVNKIFSISRTHSAYIQGFADLSLSTAPVVNERNEYGFSLGYSIAWTPEISTNLSYRYAYYDYTQGPRSDQNNTFALAITWRIRPSIFLELGGNYVINDSNIHFFNYKVFNGGPTAAVNIQW